MKLNHVRLIASDIDDTLITSDGRILPEVAAAIGRAQDSGIMVTLASGRAYPVAEPVARALRLKAPLITNNGSVVRDPQRVHYRWPVPTSYLDNLVTLAERHGLTNLWFVGDTVYAAENDDGAQYYVDVGGVPPTFVGDLKAWMSSLTGDEVSNVIMVGQEDQVAELMPQLQNEYRGRLQVSRSKPRLLEITSYGVSKRKALEVLAAEHGFSADQVMAVGDSFNDLEMLRWAGVGVAVANAPEGVRAASDLVVPSNDEGGLAVAIGMCLDQVRGLV